MLARYAASVVIAEGRADAMSENPEGRLTMAMSGYEDEVEGPMAEEEGRKAGRVSWRLSDVNEIGSRVLFIL